MAVWRRRFRSGDDGFDIIPESIGTTIDTYEENGPDESDFIVRFLNVADGTIYEYIYGSTRFAGGNEPYSIDLTLDNLFKWWIKAKSRRVIELEDEDMAQAMAIIKDKRVEVVKGRKVPMGTEGVVTGLFKKSDPYNKYGGPIMLAWIETSEGYKYCINVNNLEVLNPYAYIKYKNDKELADAAENEFIAQWLPDVKDQIAYAEWRKKQ